ncbi:hypothetical protein FACS1894178_1290 [Bacteroidia bacterium]|nr:hypothetical protein FACS1894178_1290 [Bacteroidia bacterium]
MEIDTTNVEKNLQQLAKEYPPFLEGVVVDENTIENVKSFVEDTLAVAVLNDINKKYPHLNKEEKILGNALSRYRQIFHNDSMVPDVYTFLSYFDYEGRIVFGGDFLLIALDMYLGADYPRYLEMGIPRYMSCRLESQNMLSDAMRAIAMTELGSEQPSSTFVDNMVFQGKIVCFLEEMLPEIPLEYHLGYTKKQLHYCDKNAETMWTFLASDNLFFSEDFFQMRKFFGESPTIGNFPDSPGRIAWYFGYKIVKKYREKTDVSLKQLFDNHDSKGIFNAAGYRP